MAPYFPNSKVVGTEYDSYFKQWVGDYPTTLIYRQSERSKYEEEYKKHWGPVILLIKTKDGYIFGCYTTKFYCNTRFIGII